MCRAWLKKRILFIKLTGNDPWNVSLGLKFVSELGKHSSLFLKEEGIWLLLFFMCWLCQSFGANRRGNTLPFAAYFLQRGNGISQAECRKSAESMQESYLSLSLVLIVQQLPKELLGTHVPAKSVVESDCDLARAYLRRGCGKSCTESRLIGLALPRGCGSISGTVWLHYKASPASLA